MPDPIKDLYSSVKGNGIFVDENDFRVQLAKAPKEVYSTVSDLFVDYNDFENVLGFKKKDGGTVSPISPLQSQSILAQVPEKFPLGVPGQYNALYNHTDEVLKARQKVQSTLEGSDDIYSRVVKEDRVRLFERQQRNTPTIDGFVNPAAQSVKRDLLTIIPVTQEDVFTKKQEVLQDPISSKDILKRASKKDPEVSKSVYLVDSEERAAKDPSRISTISDNANKIASGEFTYDIRSGRLQKPEGILISTFRGIKERNRQIDDYDFLTKTLNDNAIVSQLEADMKDYDPDKPMPVPEGSSASFGQMIGMEGIAMAKGASAATITSLIPGAQVAIPFVAALAASPEYYKRGYSTALRQAYYEQRQKNVPEMEALAVARKQAESEANLSAAEGIASGFVGARIGMKPTSLNLGGGFKNAVGNVIKSTANFAKENLPEGLADASVAGGLQIAKNIEAINNGLDRNIFDGVQENAAGEFGFAFGMGVLVKAGKFAVNPKSLNTIITGIAQQPKEVVDAKLGEMVINGIATPKEAVEAGKTIEEARALNSQIPQEITDEESRADIAEKIRIREDLKKELSTSNEVFHDDIKGKIKDVDQDILNIVNTQRVGENGIQVQGALESPDTQQQVGLGNTNIGGKGSVVTLAPFFNTTISSTQDAFRLRQTPEYKSYIESIPTVAKELGLEVENINDTIGGFENNQGEKIVEISNRVFLKNATVDQAEKFGAIMGTMTPETQEATIAAKYVSSEDVQNVPEEEYVEELTVKVGNLNDAIESLKKAEIYDFTIDQDTGTVSFLDFSKGKDINFDNKIATFVEELASKKIEYGKEPRKPVHSRYISPERRSQVLAGIESDASGLQQGGENLRSILSQAKQRDEGFRNKGQEVIPERIKSISKVANKLADKFRKISPELQTITEDYLGVTRQLLADNKITNADYRIAQKSKGFFDPTSNTIYLNSNKFTDDTPIHEFGHVWFGLIKKFNPELYKKGLSLAGEVKLGEAYSNLDDADYKEEFLVDLIGKKGTGIINRSSLEQWLRDVFSFIKNKLGIAGDFKNITLNEFIKLGAEDIVAGGVVTGLNNAALNPESSVGSDVDIEIKPNTKRSPLRGSWLNDSDIVNIEDLAGTKISRVVFYDNTRVGKFDVKNIKTGYAPDFDGKGGFGYSYILNIKDNNMVLAFTSIGQAIQTLKRQLQNPESIIGVAMQNQLTAHLGNLDTNRILFDSEQGIFQNAAKNKSQEKEILNVVKQSILNLSKLNSKEASDVAKVVGALNGINTINDFNKKFMLDAANSFGLRSTILKHVLQDKQTKITAATREDHRILHYKYGIPTKLDIALGINEKMFENAELGDVVKYVKPSVDKIIYTTDENLYNQYKESPTPEMVNNGIKIELIDNGLNHISYPFVIKGINVGVGDTYVNAVDLFPDLKERGIEKKQSFYSVGRMKMDAPAGEIPVGAVPQGAPLKYQVEDLTKDVKNGMPRFQIDEAAFFEEGQGKEKNRALASKFGDLNPETQSKIDDDAVTYFERPNKQTAKAVDEFIDGQNLVDMADYVLSNPDIPEVSKVWMAAEVAKRLNANISAETDPALKDALTDKQAAIYNEFAKKATSLGQAVQAFIAFKQDPNAVEFFLPKVLRQLKKAGVENVTEIQKAEIVNLLKDVNTSADGIPKDKSIIKLSHYLAGISPMKPMDVLQALWYAKILSGVTTQTTNFFANVFNTMFELPAVGLRIAIKTGNPMAVISGVKGFGSGVIKGSVAAADIFKSGVRSKEVDKYFAESPLEYFTWSKWLGKKGEALDYIPPVNFGAWKYVGRLLAATDALFSTANQEAIANMLAYAEASGTPGSNNFMKAQTILGNTKQSITDAKAQAVVEGFDPKTIQGKRRVIEIVAQKRGEKLTTEADAIGKRITLNYPPEGWTKPLFDAVVGLQKSVPVIKMVIPFARIVANLTENALNYTPAGLAKAVTGSKDPFSGMKNKLTGDERADLLAKFAIGMGALAVAATKMGDDDDDLFEITAGGSPDVQKRYELQKGGWRPYTITLKDGSKIPYKDWPIAGLLAGLGHIRDAKKYSFDDSTELGLYAYGFFLNFYDKSLLSGLQDFFGLFNVDAGRGKYAPDSKGSERLKKYAAQQVKSVALSNLSQQTGRLYSELVTGNPQRDAKTFAEILYKDIPVFNDGIRPIIDVFGEPVKYNTTERLKPVFTTESENIIKWLNENKLFVGVPQKKNIVNTDGTERPMSDDEFYEYKKLAGQKSKDWINKLISGVKNENKDISDAFFESSINAARDLAYLDILTKYGLK